MIKRTGGTHSKTHIAAQFKIFLVLALLTLIPSSVMASRYTFTAFTNSSESNMYVYQSKDGINYTCVNGPAYSPPEGLVRDTSIIKYSDGAYYIVYTTDWESAAFGIARSTDLVNWTFVSNIETGLADIKNTWAPEWFVDTDGSVNVIVSLRTHTSSEFTPYQFLALDSSLTSWSAATPLAGLEANYIDTLIVKIDGVYHAITKNETTKYLEHATAEGLTGPYTFIGTGDWAGWGDWVEGPTLTQLDNGDWRIYYDDYASPTGYYFSESSDKLATWTTPEVLPGGLSGFVRHGTVLKEDADLVLSEGPVWSWDSYNFPGRLLRHTGIGNPVRVDPDVNPTGDAEFVMVPGLADPNAVSFESVNNPGYYLRHWDYNMRLHAYNGTQTFKEDATFYYRAGLADSTYASFQSYNFPDRYIRHYGYVLRIDPISSDTARQDATFRFIGDGPVPLPYEDPKFDARVPINGESGGRIFDGIGLVNSSGSSKLLMDYPPEQQQDILDLLFKPNFGAGLSRMRNEIGGDINSSTGTEPSHQRTADEPPTARGVNFWIARQAKQLNPGMQFIGSRWGTPAWVKESDQNKRDYYLNYLQLMDNNGTPLDYLSPEENEGSFDRDYVVEVLKPALDAAGYSELKLLARDAYQSWSIADDVQSDAELKTVLAGINNHYVTSSTANAINSGLPLYNDEADTPMGDLWPRMMFVAINNAKQYVDGKMTRILYQPALDSVYGTLKFNHKGLLTANTPWSGHYTIRPSLWMTAHYTQFAKPGWQFLDSASGSVEGSTYYVTLRDPETDDYSVVIVNNSATERVFGFELSGGLSTETVHVWRSTQAEQFAQQDDITPIDNTFSITIPAQSVYSLSTTTGQRKGAPAFTVPVDDDFALPYRDDFSNYTLGTQPKFSYDQAGAFEVADCEGDPCLQQTVTTTPIDWWGGTSPTSREPHTVLGDPRWVNYQVSVDARIGESGSVLLGGRGHLHQRDSSLPGSGYQLQLWSSGNWYFRKTDFGSLTDVATGNVAGFDASGWNNLKLHMNGTMISAYINDVELASIIDDSFSSGQVVLASSEYSNVAFDNLLIEPISENIDVTALKVNDSNTDLITYNGNWQLQDGNWRDHHRSARRSNEANASLEYEFTGTEITLLGRLASDGGEADVYIDDVLQSRIDTYGNTRYRAALYKATGLDSGSHTLKLVVSGTRNAASSEAYVYIDSIETLDGTDIMPMPTPTPPPSEIDVNDSVTGTGENQFEFVGSWGYGSQAGAYLDDNHWEGDADGYYQVRFTGTQISVFGATAANHGIAAISIDDDEETLVDFYSANRVEQALVYTSPALDFGTHILKVRVTGTANPASSGVIIPADRVHINLEEPEPTVLSINDNLTGTGENQFEFVGSWGYGAQAGAYLDDNHWEGDTDGYYQLRFTGSQVSVYGALAPSHGIAAISIDGGDETLVDFYASTRTEQTLVYTSAALDYGSHILKVRVTGTSNAASSGVIIPADRVDINTSEPTPTPEPEPVIYSYSSAQSGNEPQNLLDGDTSDSSRWSASGFPQALTIDYGAVKEIVATQLWTYQSRAYQYTVEVSEEADSEYTTVVDRSENTASEQPISDKFIAVKGRYVRITVTGASGYSGSWVALNDFTITTTADLPQVDLALNLEGPESLQACSPMPYSLTINNLSELDAGGFFAALQIPEGISYIHDSYLNSKVQQGANGAIGWYIDTLAAGETLTIKLDLQLSSSVPIDKDISLGASLISSSAPENLAALLQASGFAPSQTDPNADNDGASLSLKTLPGLFAREQLQLADSVEIDTPATYTTHLSLGAHSALIKGSSVWVDGPAFLRSNSYIDGSLNITGALELQNGAEVRGETNSVENISIASLPSFAVNSGTEDLTINNDQTGIWQPGSYQNAIIRARGTVTLSSGDYHFNQLNVEPTARVIFDTSSGPIKIFSKETLNLGDRDSLFIPQGAKVLFYTNAQNDIRVGTNESMLNASILAPRGKVLVYSNSVINGSIGAEIIQLEPRSSVSAICE